MDSVGMVAALAEMVAEVTSGRRICMKATALDAILICLTTLGRYVNVGVVHGDYLYGGKDASARSIHTVVEGATAVLGVLFRRAVLLGDGRRIFKRH